MSAAAAQRRDVVGPATPTDTSHGEPLPPEPMAVKSEAANGGGLKGQTLQPSAQGEQWGHEMDPQT
jgi:hypothetical protein